MGKSQQSLNLEKYRAAQGSLSTITVNGNEIKEPQEISNVLHDFNQILFKEKLSISEETSTQIFLNKVSLPKLNNNKALECAGVINENELLKAFTSTDKDKTPGNDGITTEFYVKFRDFLKEAICASIQGFFG